MRLDNGSECYLIFQKNTIYYLIVDLYLFLILKSIRNVAVDYSKLLVFHFLISLFIINVLKFNIK
jgi:hypothetical protein